MPDLPQRLWQFVGMVHGGICKVRRLEFAFQAHFSASDTQKAAAVRDSLNPDLVTEAEYLAKLEAVHAAIHALHTTFIHAHPLSEPWYVDSIRAVLLRPRSDQVMSHRVTFLIEKQNRIREGFRGDECSGR